MQLDSSSVYAKKTSTKKQPAAIGSILCFDGFTAFQTAKWRATLDDMKSMSSIQFMCSAVQAAERSKHLQLVATA